MELILGLGGNLGDPPAAFRTALRELARGRRIGALSRLYRSAPVGPEQPLFWNLAALVEVGEPLLALLACCQRLEATAGRDRRGEPRWGPRPLDVDLLIADRVVHRGPRLELPHPRLHERAFALVPAAEVAAKWTHPLLGRTIDDLATEVSAREPGAVEVVGPLDG